jgi:hypothetical protein
VAHAADVIVDVVLGNSWQSLGTHTSLDFYLIIEQLLFRSLL